VKLSDMLVAQARAQNGGALKGNSIMAQIAKRRGVSRTSEFTRIENLARRVWDAPPALVEGLTDLLRVPGGTFVLTPIQAAALRDAHDLRGAFLPIAVGAGKSFISVLIAELLNAERPLLLVPADLREQTRRKVIPLLRQHFKVSPNLAIVSHTALSLAKNADMLERLKPDLIIIDECHAFKNTRAGRTRRMNRYMKAHPETAVVAMSGTITNRSLKDYAHVMRWCLGEKETPLPNRWPELSEWAAALDEGIPDQSRMAPGVLTTFKDTGDTNVRQGYRRRLVETPGVVASGAEELGTALTIRRLDPTLPGVMRGHLKRLRDLWEDPNGDQLTEAVDVWRTARQLALGFWYKWDPPGPRGWLDARREWKRYVRETLKHNQRGLDTELQVWNEAQAVGTLPAWREWNAIKDTFKPNTVPVWESDFIVGEVSRWLEGGEGIVWVEHTAVGNLLATRLGLPYYGAGKRASLEILDARGPIIASIAAHGTGKNLQQWSRNLITAPPTSGKTWEQLLGRTHRRGQEEDEVIVDVYLHAEELVASFTQARSDARYIEDTLGARQRLNYAAIAFAV
jgi:hypothetical protein